MMAVFPSAEVMSEFVGWFGAWVLYGIGLSIVFWTLGYCVWFIIQFFR